MQCNILSTCHCMLRIDRRILPQPTRPGTEARAYPRVQGACSLASHRLPVGPAAVLALAAPKAALPIVGQVEGLVQETRAVGCCAGRRPQLQRRRLLDELPVAKPPAGALLAEAWRAFSRARAVACIACWLLEPTLCSSPPSTNTHSLWTDLMLH